jgi:hypothetical protein
MLTRQQEDGQTIRLTVKSLDEGWEVREERNDAVVRVTRQKDWHRQADRIADRQAKPKKGLIPESQAAFRQKRSCSPPPNCSTRRVANRARMEQSSTITTSTSAPAWPAGASHAATAHT